MDGWIDGLKAILGIDYSIKNVRNFQKKILNKRIFVFKYNKESNESPKTHQTIETFNFVEIFSLNIKIHKTIFMVHKFKTHKKQIILCF